MSSLLALVVLAACAAAPAPRVETLARAARAPLPPAPRVPDEPAPPPPREVTIGAAGDVLVHLKVTQAAHDHEEGFGRVFGELASIIDDHEVAFVNLETPLSARVPAETGDPPVLGAPATVAAGLAGAGVDVVSVANNHSYDQTAGGLEDTLRALAEAGVFAVGADVDAPRSPGPLVIERDGVRVAFVAYTERVNRGPIARGTYTHVARFDLEEAEVLLRAAREVADVVVLSIHWSNDFVTEPWAHQRSRARRLVEAGADLVLGHGPHVIQEVERLESSRGDALVAYSLGNLVSNQGLRYFAGRRIPDDMHPAVVLPATRDGVWLRTRVRLSQGRVQITSVTAVPLWTENNYLRVARRQDEVLDIRVGRLSAADDAIRAERRPIIERALGPEVTLVDD